MDGKQGVRKVGIIMFFMAHGTSNRGPRIGNKVQVRTVIHTIDLTS